ncbi:MAG: endonuclease/exonuclease/phosphatase family protein [Thermodesulfobacteriota bacterium]
MKKFFSGGSLLFLLLLGSLSLPVSADFQNLAQQPQESQASIKILTLNVMQQASEARAARFQRIVDFLAAAPVHLLALQELSGGPYDTPPTQDSGADLAAMLAAAGWQYGYYTEANWGYPPYLVFKVGILPRYTMTATAAASTGTPTDLPGPDFPGRKNVVMAQVNIPGFGRINLYSVHIYTPSVEGIEPQIDNLMAFVNRVDAENPAVASLVAGDMNFSINESPAAYQKFLDQGFIDSYAGANGFADPQNCCTPSNTGGCTVGVPGNPFASIGSPSRIDFLFVRGKGVRLKQSQVVFNGVNQDFVSDHCAVLTEIARTSIDPSRFLLLGE